MMEKQETGCRAVAGAVCALGVIVVENDRSYPNDGILPPPALGKEPWPGAFLSRKNQKNVPFWQMPTEAFFVYKAG